MPAKIIGFAGIEAADIIMYIARILYHIGYKVLICDYSPADELKYFIPLADEVNLEEDCVDYRGVDFTKQLLHDKQKKEYDVVLVNFGFSENSFCVNLCGYFIYVTDRNRAHIKKLLMMKHDTESTKIRQLIVRDVTIGKAGACTDMKELKKNLAPQGCYKISLNSNDCRILYQMQNGGRFCFFNISNELYHCICGILDDCFGDLIVKKELGRAISRAMKGK